MADYTKYTNKEMQAITLAQQITDDNIAIVGTGLPLIGASVAKRLFAPKCNLIVESGLNVLLRVVPCAACVRHKDSHQNACYQGTCQQTA